MSATSAAPCGQVPASTGPAADLVTLQLTAPSVGRAGTDISVRSVIDVHADGQRIITGPGMAEVVIAQQGKVVGRSSEARPDLAIPLVLKAGSVRPAQALPSMVQLSGCPDGASGTRSPLPPGQYELIGIMGYRLDPFNSGFDGMRAGGQFEIVSQPVLVTVT
jgi:hypothetical protein